MSSTTPPSDGADYGAILRRTDEVVDAFVDAGRARRVLDAREFRLLARADALIGESVSTGTLRGNGREIARRAMIADLATAAHLSEWTVTRLLGQAADLCERFDAAVDTLERGEISRQHVLVIHEAGVAILDDQARATYLELALKAAREATPGRLRPVVEAFAERFLDRSLDERAADAAALREVRVRDLSDGMAQLLAVVPATLAHGIDDRLTEQARAVIDARPDETDTDADADACESGAESDAEADTRTLAQIRADVFTDLLLTGTPDECIGGDGLSEIRATVQVTVPVLTMTGHSDDPVLLAGYGPIDTDTARELAGGATGWERVLTSPVTGEVLAVERYRPQIALKRFLRARDERCRFPGCRRPVWRCEIDHTKAASEGGPTCPGNTAHLCKRHHVLKTVAAWTVEQVSAGVLVWTSPTGRRHTDRPEPVIRFVPDDDLLARRRPREDLELFPYDGTAPF